MNFVELFGFAYEALRERKLRSGLTVLMVVMGASLIVALNGMSNGFSRFVDDQFATLGANVLILSPRGQNLEIDYELVETVSKITGVAEVIPYVQQSSQISTGTEEQTTIFVGMEQSKLPLLFPTLNVEEGGFVSPSDNIGILLGSEVAQKGQGEIFAVLGQTVKATFRTFEEQKMVVKTRSFIVRGILSNVGSAVIPVDQMVFISTSAADSFFERKRRFDGVYVLTDEPEVNADVRDEIRELYGREVVLISPQTIADAIQTVSSGVSLFMGFIASVSLLVASVGIVTTLNTSMMERIREIGLLKALGFNRRLILTAFLDEALIIGLIGSVTGVLSGIGLSYILSFTVGRWSRPTASTQVGMRSFTFSLAPVFDPMNLLLTVLLCVALSALAGFYPAWRASRLDPVVALRHE